MENQAGPNENTKKIFAAIEVALKSDRIDNPWPTHENWYIGYSDSPQIRTGKRRFHYYEIDDKVQVMIIFSSLREQGMIEEKYHISNDSNIKYIMIYHN